MSLAETTAETVTTSGWVYIDTSTSPGSRVLGHSTQSMYSNSIHNNTGSVYEYKLP